MSSKDANAVTRDELIGGINKSSRMTVSAKGKLVEAIGAESDPSKILGIMHEVLESKTIFGPCQPVDVVIPDVSIKSCMTAENLFDPPPIDLPDDFPCTTCETDCGEQFV